MRLKWHAKWRNPVRKGVRSGLPARSSTLTPRGEAISMSFGFDRLAPPRRCERLENETYFLRFRALTRSKPPQTIPASFMGPSPSHLNLKFDSFCSGPRTNFRFKKVTSKSMFLVRFKNLKFASETAGAMMRTSNSPEHFDPGVVGNVNVVKVFKCRHHTAQTCSEDGPVAVG